MSKTRKELQDLILAYESGVLKSSLFKEGSKGVETVSADVDLGGSTTEAVHPQKDDKFCAIKVEKLIQQDFDPKLKAKIERLCIHAEQSSITLREKLSKAGFDKSEIERAIDWASNIGLVDDRRFARVALLSWLNQGRGMLYIEHELKRLGLKLSDIDGWPEEFSFNEGSELDRAVRILSSWTTYSKKPYEAAIRKLIARGFSYDIAKKAALDFVKRS